MFIVYHYNEPIAAVSTLDAAARIKEKIGQPGKVKIIYEKA